MKTPAQLKSRLLTGSLLILALTSVLYGDGYLDPRQRFLPLCLLVLAILAGIEIHGLLPKGQPRLSILLPVLALIILLHWHWLDDWSRAWRPTMELGKRPPWLSPYTLPVLILGITIAMLVEILQYAGDGQGTARVSNTLFLCCYLGIPAQVLVNLRYLPEFPATLAIAATILVPKLGDVAAYFTGSLVGRHKMTPTLSPKKTWEGLAGGLAVSMLTAIAINQIGPEPLFKKGVLQSAAFGLVVGLAGVFGDLFASMIKRDAQVKDASQSIPGFGGVLDVIDSVLFAAPAAYLFFVL